MIFDTHAHYEDERFDEDRDELLGSMNPNGVGLIVNVGSSMKTSQSSIDLSEKYAYIYAAAGVHPENVGDMTAADILKLKEMSAHKKVVAIGEIGLDYYYMPPEYDAPTKEVQQEWFAKQLSLAKEVQLPVIIHSRDAAKDTYDIMKAENAEEMGGVVHCYSYSVEMAREFLNMGFYIGIGGVLTFKNSRKLREVAEYVPLDKIVIETDCPYMAPTPFRGKRNNSLYLKYVVEELARIKGMSEEAIATATYNNGLRMYRIEG